MNYTCTAVQSCERVQGGIGLYHCSRRGTGLLRDTGMFKEGYRDTSLDRVQACTGGGAGGGGGFTGLYSGYRLVQG